MKTLIPNTTQEEAALTTSAKAEEKAPGSDAKRRSYRVMTFDARIKIAPPAINRPLRSSCGERCAKCGAMRCSKPKRR